MDWEIKAIVSVEGRDFREDRSAVSLIFDAGGRPDISAIATIAASNGNFSLNSNPPGISLGAKGWVELLVNGLTFDVTGLRPGPGDAQPEQKHLFGLTGTSDFAACETVTIRPGTHLSGGRTMFPVLRSLALVAALLSDLPQLRAIAWHPARSWSEPGYFRSIVFRWIEGGVFPGLGLTAVTPTEEGGLMSEGLATFSGQELVLSPELARDRAEGTKLALRLINWLTENGRIDEGTSIMGPSGETLHLVPDANQQFVKVTASF
ncbi:hypothetical protein [Aurantiacibacter flavus]|uniref:DUF4261 domain-containing protein n=1 Tax=Aurantiacibacter flavus TaxID=3145232 RepID=A0ABV0CU70_9SPHN